MTSVTTSGAAALVSAPMMKTTAEARIIPRRPRASASRPAKSAPTTAPIGTAATTRPDSRLESPNSGSMNSRAAAIIPVS